MNTPRAVKMFPLTTAMFGYFLVSIIVGGLTGLNTWFGLYCAFGLLPIACWSDIRDRRKKEAQS